MPIKLTSIKKHFIIRYREKLSIRERRIKKMRLKEGKDNCTYIVESIDMELNLERRLEALGLTQGSRITILNNDKKGAITVRFRCTRFALGKRIADHIMVGENMA